MANQMLAAYVSCRVCACLVYVVFAVKAGAHNLEHKEARTY